MPQRCFEALRYAKTSGTKRIVGRWNTQNTWAVAMKYDEILRMPEDEILLQVKSSDEDEVIYAVLSAIYHYDSDFAGHLLLSSLRSTQGMLRFRLADLVVTYMRIHQTNYLADSIIEELRKRDASAPSYDAAYEENIEHASRLARNFGNRGN